MHCTSHRPGAPHVDQAVDRLGTSDQFTAVVGDARGLEHPDEAFDAVLLFGPLYHLADRTDRMQAWAEALRVAAPGGVVFAVGISRFAELSVGLGRGLIFDDAFRHMMERTLDDGQHRNPDDREYFTTAFYHHPDELEAEAIRARDAGLPRPGSAVEDHDSTELHHVNGSVPICSVGVWGCPG